MQWPRSGDTALAMPAEVSTPHKSWSAPPGGSPTSSSLGHPLPLLAFRAAAAALSLLVAVPTLIPRLRDSPAAADAYRYASVDVRRAALFYSTWTFYLCGLYFLAATVASGQRVGWRVAESRKARRRGGVSSAAALSPDAAAAARADTGVAAAIAAALLHAAGPAAAFVCFSTVFVVLPAAAATGSQEELWAVVGTLATPLGLAAAGGGLAALAADLALSRARFPRPAWLLLTTGWPASFMAASAVAAAVRWGGGASSAGPAATAATSPAAGPAPGLAPGPGVDWGGSAAAKQLACTLIAHLVAAVGLGCVAWAREVVCAAGAAVAKRVKRS